MHVLMIPSWYPTAEDPILGIFFREQALAISQAGVKVGLISPHLYSLRKKLASHKPNTGLDIYSDFDVRTYRFYDWNWSYKLSAFRHRHWLMLGYRLFKLYLKEHGLPDVIHVQSALLAGALALKIRQRHNVPFVVTEHSSVFALSSLSKLEIKTFKRVFSESSKNIVVSPSLGHILENKLCSDHFLWTWIPNFLDQRFEKQANKKIGSSPLDSQSNEEFTFLNVAAATENKGQINLVRAFLEAFAGERNVKLKIGGAGPALEAMRQVVHEKKSQEQVYFLGSLSREQVVNEMTAATAFVLPSHYETFGVVLIEALACGKPVIATRCGGPECIVEAGDGLLVKNGDIKALSTAMKSLRKNIKTYHADDIKHRCMRRFGSTSVIGKIIEVYAGVIQAKTV